MKAGDSRAVCVIPARGGSKRLPRKNILPLGGKPLIAWATEAARASGVFNEVIVSSEDSEILAVAGELEGVRALPRDPSLAGDRNTVVQVVRAVLEELAAEGNSYDHVGIFLATSPFRRVADITRARNLLEQPGVDAVMSVVPVSHPPQHAIWMPEGHVVPYFPRFAGVKRQDLDNLYRHDGAVYLARVEPFRERFLYRGQGVTALEVDPDSSVDIDTERDLTWAQFLLEKGLVAEHVKP